MLNGTEEIFGLETPAPVKVLVVDDRPENLLALEATLSGSGAHIEYVRTAQEALRYLLIEEVALILLDVQMPGVSGFELAELIRQREQTQNTPIIFISATSVDREYVFQGYSLGAVDYLTKPFEPEILRSKVAFFTALYEKNSEIKRQSKLLEEANAALDALNEDLEERVRQRTAEIETAYRRLGEEAANRSRTQARLSLEYTITRELATAESVDAACPVILKAFCTYLAADLSCFWLLSGDGRTVDCACVEAAKKTAAIELFVRSPLNGKFEKGSGLPGVVWEKNAPVWLPLSGSDDRFPRAQLAAVAGFTHAVGIPIRMGNEFLGIMEFFTSHTIEQEPELLRMFEVLGSEIGQFIRRKRVETEKEKLLRQEMTLRQQAERASRLKDEFLATVSHELRTPLNSILGWSQILRREALPEEQKESALATIHRNAQAQAQLINDLLDMSRLITGNFPLDLAPTSARSVIEEAIGIVRPQAEAKSVRLETRFEADDVEVTCDAERVQQMVWNLLVNAIKFTPEGGAVEVGLDTRGNEVAITVRDNGQGIDPEFLPHVFDRFRQGDSSSTRKHRGLGLGLAIVTNLAELHGGRVTVNSEGIGKGAEFTILLPANSARNTTSVGAGQSDQPSNGHAAAEHDALMLKDVRVLIVEDDEDAAEMLQFALREIGAEARTANSVAEAFECLSEWVPNAVLSDITMPEEDGYSLIKRLRRLPEPEISSLPAIALTAMARPEDGDRAISSGFQLHMTKPVDLEELARGIAGLVNGLQKAANKTTE
jgi:signal transduction histidine kinase/DNA-binding response OmpR family regulator